MDEIERLVDEVDKAKERIKSMTSAEVKRLMKTYGYKGQDKNRNEFYITLLNNKRLETPLDGCYIEVHEVVYYPKYDEVEVSYDKIDLLECDIRHGNDDINFESIGYRNQADLVKILRNEMEE